MQPVYLFNLAAKQADWLSVRQSVIAQNIANANTPGYKAQDVQSFSDTLDATKLAIVSTSGAHLSPGSNAARTEVQESENSWEVFASGGSVSLDQELLKTGQVNGQFSLNAGLTKAFHRMLLMSMKG